MPPLQRCDAAPAAGARGRGSGGGSPPGPRLQLRSPARRRAVGDIRAPPPPHRRAHGHGAARREQAPAKSGGGAGRRRGARERRGAAAASSLSTLEIARAGGGPRERGAKARRLAPQRRVRRRRAASRAPTQAGGLAGARHRAGEEVPARATARQQRAGGRGKGSTRRRARGGVGRAGARISGKAPSTAHAASRSTSETLPQFFARAPSAFALLASAHERVAAARCRVEEHAASIAFRRPDHGAIPTRPPVSESGNVSLAEEFQVGSDDGFVLAAAAQRRPPPPPARPPGGRRRRRRPGGGAPATTCRPLRRRRRGRGKKKKKNALVRLDARARDGEHVRYARDAPKKTHTRDDGQFGARCSLARKKISKAVKKKKSPGVFDSARRLVAAAVSQRGDRERQRCGWRIRRTPAASRARTLVSKMV